VFFTGGATPCESDDRYATEEEEQKCNSHEYTLAIENVAEDTYEVIIHH
jgi:hypothetical protein